MTALAEAFVAVRADTSKVKGDIQDGFRGSEREAEAAGRRHGEAFSSGVGNVLVGAGRLFGAAAISGGVALAALGAAGVVAGVKTAGAMEQAQISFETMLGSAQKADTFLKQLADFAKATPFEFPELQTAASSLISIGIDSSKVIPIMRTLGDATSGMGTGSEGIKRATIAIQQMNAAGKIQAEDLNQLRDAGIPVYDLLSAALGKPREAIAELAQKGKLGKDALDKMMSALETGKGLERFTGLMEKQSKSLEGTFSTLKDTVMMGLAKAVEPLIPMLKDATVGATEFATKALPAIGDGLKKAAEWIGPAKDQLAGMFTGMDTEKAASLGKQIMDSLAPAGEFIKNEIGPKFQIIGDAIMNFETRLLPIISKFVNGMIERLQPLLPTIGAIFRSIGDIIKSVLDIIGQVIGLAIGAIEWAWTQWGQGLMDTIRVVWGAIIGIIGPAVNVIRDIINAVMQALHGDWSEAWESIKSALGNVWELIKGIIIGALGLIQQALSMAWSAITWAVSYVWQFILSIIQGIWNAIYGYIEAQVNRLTGFLSEAWNNIANWVSAAWNGIAAFFSWVWNAIYGYVEAQVNRLRGFLADAWNNIAAVVSAVWGGIQAVIGGVAGWFTGTLVPIFQNAWNNLQTGFETVGNVIRGVWNGLKEAAAVPIRWVIETVFGGVVRGFNAVSGKVGGPLIDEPHAGFDAGGYTGDGDKYEPAGVVHRGEFVINKKSTAKIMQRAPSLLAGLNSYADGGLVGWLQNVASNIGGFFSDPLGSISRLIDGLLGNLESTTLGKMGVSMARKLGSAIVDKLKGLWDAMTAATAAASGPMGGPTGQAGPGGSGGAARWASVALQAMSMAGLDASYLPLLLYRMNVESGGNPNAINLWDSNAKAGYPSQGLMQTIPGTFNAYAGIFAGRGITDPFANIYAAIKYTLSRYGLSGIQRAWGGTGGYLSGGLVMPSFDRGGTLRPGANMVWNGTGRDETLTPDEQSRVVVHNEWHVSVSDPHELADLVEARMAFRMAAVT